MNKIGILYICTGKYSVFWNDFYQSTEEKFLINSDKHYFIWTDDRDIIKSTRDNDHINSYYQKAEPWPFPTLKRFEYFLMAEDKIKEMDYVFFMNGNLLVNEFIREEEILPKEDERLVVTIHPGYYDANPKDYPYDRNQECSACVKIDEGEHYFAGGFNGGNPRDYLELCHTLSNRIKDDLNEGVIALWHDESQINRYMIDFKYPYKILDSGFLYPEGWSIPFNKKIIVLNKQKKGGHDYIRNLNYEKESSHGGIQNHHTDKEILISIIVPAYNSDKTIESCIDSILHQDHRNIEVIIIDDGSTDNTNKIAKEYCDKDKRVRIITKNKNESLLSARISGMKAMTGDYCLFVDSDDKISKDTCRIIVAEEMLNPVDIMEFSYIIEPSGKIVSETVSPQDLGEAILKREYPHTVWNKCYSSELVHRFLEVSEDYYCNMSEDDYFSILFSLLSNSWRRINSVLYKYTYCDGMSAVNEFDENWIDRSLESIVAKNKHVRLFLTKYRPDLWKYANEGKKVDIDFIAGRCRRSSMSLRRILELMGYIDEKCGTTYEKDYANELIVNSEKYESFITAPKRKKLAMIFSYCIGKLKKRIQNN